MVRRWGDEERMHRRKEVVVRSKENTADILGPCGVEHDKPGVICTAGTKKRSGKTFHFFNALSPYYVPPHAPLQAPSPPSLLCTEDAKKRRSVPPEVLQTVERKCVGTMGCMSIKYQLFVLN